MPTIFRVRALRVVIYPNDHWPPHVHVVGPEGEAIVVLRRSGEQLMVVLNSGISRRYMTAVLNEIDGRHDLLMQRWREIHGDA